jgi:RNA polymerase sigma-70 factor (ECF subfamily)
MQAAQAGDQHAYARLLRELSQSAEAYARPRLADAAAVQDFAQEVLLLVHRGRHSFRPDRAFTPWFFAIVRHRFIDFLRSEARRAPATDNELDLNLVASSDPDWITLDVVHEAIGRLPATQQRAIRLRLEGRSVEETAREMNLGLTAARVATHRARKALRKLLREHYGFD